jgi:DNA-binding NtrC family response regulator
VDVLIVEDKASLRKALLEALRAEGFEAEAAATGEEALSILQRERPGALVTDLRLPGVSGHEVIEAASACDPPPAVILMTAYGTVADAVRAMKAGAADVLEKPVDASHLAALVRRALEAQALRRENILLREQAGERWGAPPIIGSDPGMRGAAEAAQRAAATDATVLLLGESGTGKELFAHAVHALSKRREKPFVAINCAAIPESLLENELFGHEKGSYTGAHEAAAGKFELAQGGTVFLDEIAEMSPALQAKLLRVLESRRFERIGGRRSVAVDIRLVAATNRNLEAERAAGRFREDLYYRLSVLPITIPPLRERRGDIPALADYFLARAAKRFGRKNLSFSPQAREAMQGHAWPGNVRELQNAVERAAIFCGGDGLILPEHLMLVPD